MRKRLFVLILMLLMIKPVMAIDNKLFLTEKDNKIYYDEELFKKEDFMHHLDMVPGGKYQDDLVIENGAKIPLKIYLQVKEDEQSSDAEELLDSIFMKVTLNDNVIYDGKVKGLDYNSNGVNLQDSVYLKDFAVGESAKIHVDLYLDSAYANKEFNDYTYLNWLFIAQFDTSITEVVPAPITGINQNYIPIIIISTGLCIVGCIIIVLAKKKKSNE